MSERSLFGLKTQRIFFGLFLCATAWANPIIVFDHGTYYSERKSSESCIVVADHDVSTVICEVSYSLKPAKALVDSYYVFIALPVFVAARESWSVSELNDTLAPRVHCNGKVNAADGLPTLIRDVNELAGYHAPQGTYVALFRFTVEVGLRKKDIRLLVNYKQPTIDGRFYYLPLFEDGLAARNLDRFRFDVVSVNPTVHLQSGVGGHVMELAPNRLKFELQHKRLVAVNIERTSMETTSVAKGAVHEP